ncbi:MAG: prephenate dehydratase domain-containing protein [Lachnospiraceae bacterium]|nr:prephenate dehydratase domain-containing protein [Lachnospiraceae bacterium]
MSLSDKTFSEPEFVETPFPSRAMVACQGIRGAYSQITAQRLFPEGTFIYFKNFGAVVRAVREEMCEYGVLPIENNTYGSVKDVYRLLSRGEVNVVRGYRLKIDHVLLAREGTSLKDVKKVMSHEQALGQCDEFLKSLGDKVELVPALNTAVAARSVAASPDPYCAAISSPECAALYGLAILKKKIADNDHNYTRFLCIGKKKAVYPGANRISIILTLPHKPGTLSRILNEIAGAGLNLLKLESAPIPGKDFEFIFYIDIEGSIEDPATVAALKNIREESTGFAFLGNYEELSAENMV